MRAGGILLSCRPSPRWIDPTRWPAAFLCGCAIPLKPEPNPSVKTPASPILLPSTLRLALTVLAGVTASSPATILTFNTSPAAAANSPMPQDYGDNASALSQLSANGLYQNQYDIDKLN